MLSLLRTFLVFSLSAVAPILADEAKTVRVLAIGNSFSGNATRNLEKMAAAGGHQWIFGHAMISGSPFEKHLLHVREFEIDPEDPKGKPYNVEIDGKKERVSLRYLLESQPWDYVTIQQASHLSYQPATFEPHASELVAYVRKFAPQAKIVIHETWAYREDHGLFKNGFTQAQMYRRLHDNYQWLANQIGAAGIIPVGTAFQNVREDARWKPVLEQVDVSAYQHPDLPPEDHDLNVGYAWRKERGGRVLAQDRSHASRLGCYLGSCVWYEFFFGDVRSNSYLPPRVSEQDASLLKEIAHRTVKGGLVPKAPSATAPEENPSD